jgi:TonB-linked SusC/RagA family outer membrane protein
MRIFKLVCYTALLLLFCRETTKAQTSTVRGKVIDAKDKGGVPVASVIELDKDDRTVSSTLTDIDGNFALKVKSLSGRIKISSIGYDAQVISINSRTTINVVLKPSSRQISEVVIKGQRSFNNGMQNIDPKHNTMAIATINAKDLEELSAQSIDQALQGRLPGVDIASQSGDPGAGMAIRIRGTATLNGNSQPMVVVDGMPYETEIPSDFNFGNADEQGYAALLSIAPTDIKDISVLKDAASTAMWGSRAANGVIVINTKRGTVSKPQIGYSFMGFLSKQPKTFPLLSGDEYSVLIPEMYRNATGLPLNLTLNKEFAYDPYDPAYYYNYSQNTNWLDEITQLAFTHQHDVNISGGGEKARYYVSAGYTNQQGTTIGTNSSTIRTRVNLDYIVSSKIRFSSDFAYSHTDNLMNYTNPRGEAYTKMPNMGSYMFDILGNQTTAYFSPESNIQGSYLSTDPTYNPLAMAKGAKSHALGDRLIPTFRLQYNITPQLSANLQVRFDINNVKTNNFLPQVATGRPFTESVVNNASDSDGDSYNTTAIFNVSYTPKFKSTNHSLNVFGSFQARNNQNVSNFVRVANTATSLFEDPSNAARVTGTNTGLSSNLGYTKELGAYVSAQYTLLQRYDVNIGIRTDGNSRTSPQHRFNTYPSLSTRWHISEEGFLRKKKFKWLEDLSFRASYGISGNPPNGSYFSIISPTSMVETPLSNSRSRIYYPGSYVGTDGSLAAGVLAANMQITSLRSERTSGTNLGFNLWLFDSRLKIDGEVYKNVTREMFLNPLAIPSHTGYSGIGSNNGKMTNTGFELLLQTTPIKNKTWLVNFDFNFARNQNVVNEISEYYPRENGAKITDNGRYKTYLQLGNPFGSFYGYRTQGVYKDLDATYARDENNKVIYTPGGEPVRMRFNYPITDYTFQPGDVAYVDINNDGNINYMDQVYLGTGLPSVSGGFGPSVTYKGRFTLRTFFNYRLNYQLVNVARMNSVAMYNYNNQSTAVLKRWRNPGDVTDMPRALFNTGFNWLGSDRFVEDASFVRLRQVTLSYKLSQRFADRIGVKRANAYITGENLYTWTNYTGQNPDVGGAFLNDPFGYPQDNSSTPPPRNFIVGLTVGF